MAQETTAVSGISAEEFVLLDAALEGAMADVPAEVRGQIVRVITNAGQQYGYKNVMRALNGQTPRHLTAAAIAEARAAFAEDEDEDEIAATA